MTFRVTLSETAARPLRKLAAGTRTRIVKGLRWRAVYGNVAKPAFRKFASNVRAFRIPRFSMRTKEVQSVNDHRLSDRRTKSFQAAAKAGDSTRTRRRFFDCSIAWPAAEACSWRFARATRAVTVSSKT